MRLGTRMPFAQAATELAFFWGVTLDETTVRRHTEAAGAAYVAVQAADLARLEAERPPAPVGPAVQYLSADGAMVPLVQGAWAEVKTLAVGTVVAPPGEDGLLAPQTTDLSYFSRLADAATFTQHAYVETYRRGTETAGVVCAVQDGAEWLQGLVDVLRPDAVRILDFPHAVEYLTTAAQTTWGATAPEAAQWLSEQAHTFKHAADGAAQVISALARLPVQQAGDPPAAVAARATALNYLTRRLPQVQYAAFGAAGYPIGSGSTESANKTVVEARLKGSGMHWARGHVDPLVALRTVACADRWAEAWPQITAQRREQAATRRRTRWQARHSQPLPAAAPPPASVPPPPSAASPWAARAKLVVNGRPTAWHPWKRYPCLPGGRRALAAP